MPVDLIVFAAIAVFVLLRLYGVLGQQTGRDEPPANRDASFDSGGKVIELTPRQLERPQIEAEVEEEPSDAVTDELKEGIKAIRREDRGFRLKGFMDGAKVAFEMVLEAFSKGDQETLRALLSKELYEEFSNELKQRRQSQEYQDMTLIAILEAEPQAIEVENKQAKVTVRFLSEQIGVTRLASGETVKESTSAIEQVEDEWVFVRDLRSPNPNWKIITT